MDTYQDYARTILLGGGLGEKVLDASFEWSEWKPFELPRLPGRNQKLAFSEEQFKFPKGKQLNETDKKALALHSFANHELLAIEMMAAALLIYPHKTDEDVRFKKGIVTALKDEQKHLQLYIGRLNQLGYEFGDFPLNDFFWRQMEKLKTPNQYAAVMAMTFEAANLDFAQYYARLFRGFGDIETAQILETVLEDEITHVAFGAHWMKRWRQDEKLWNYYLASLPWPLTPARSKGIHFDPKIHQKAVGDEEFMQALVDFQDSLPSRREISMKAIKVNADYETVLAGGNPSDLANQSLEFLAFFLDDRPVFSHKKYSPEYLDYVTQVTGKRPQIVGTGETENWWGQLKDKDLERRFNSKLTSAQLNGDKGWPPQVHIINYQHDFERVIWPGEYLAKVPLSMSGQEFQFLQGEDDTKGLALPLVLEPLLKRKKDFSCYAFPEKTVFYENLVDERFQYKGTVFQNYQDPTVEQFSFFQGFSPAQWTDYEKKIHQVIGHYRDMGAKDGFSIDSFSYEVQGKDFIRVLSEINYRKTMGWACYQLAQKYGGENPWAALMLTKSNKSNGGFPDLREKLSSWEWSKSKQARIIILSPGDTRFEVFFLSAVSQKIGIELLSAIWPASQLLPTGQFPVKV